MGKGVIDAVDQRFLFTAGCAPQDYPQGLLGRADLVIAVGYDMIEWPPAAWNPDGRAADRLRRHGAPEIDADYLPEVELVGDLSRILLQLAGLLEGRRSRASSQAVPRAFRRVLDAGTDDDLPDQAAARPARPARRRHGARGRAHLRRRRPQAVGRARFWEPRANTVLIANGLASMGFVAPGRRWPRRSRPRPPARSCAPRRRRLPHERAGARDRRAPRLPLRRRRLDDGGYGLIDINQRRQFGRASACGLRQPGLRRVWRGPFDVDGVRVERAGDLPGILAKALDAAGPVIVDIPIDYAENDKLGIDLWKLAPEALA